jgi:hypothetical protein
MANVVTLKPEFVSILSEVLNIVANGCGKPELSVTYELGVVAQCPNATWYNKRFDIQAEALAEFAHYRALAGNEINS